MFRLNRLTDYGVVVLTQLYQSTTGLASAQQIARRTGVPVPTVAKVLNVLTRDGLVESHRGAAGGYALARPASEIGVSEIIQALEGPIALTACVENADGHCGNEALCPMRGGWEKVNRAIQEALESVTLADMIGSAMPIRAGSDTAESGATQVGSAG